jgi:hypothetical protein
MFLYKCVFFGILKFNNQVYSMKNNLYLKGSDGWVRAWDLKNMQPCEANDRVYCRQESMVYFTVGKCSSLISKVELPSAKSDLVWLLQVIICVTRVAEKFKCVFE